MKGTIKDEQLWIDYLEGDIEPSLKEDMDIHLQNSPEIQKIVYDYQQLKSNISKADHLPHSNQGNQDRIHDQIMNKISRSSKRSSFFPLSYQTHKLLMIAAAFLIVLGSLFAWNLHQMGQTDRLLGGQDDMAVNPTGDWSLEQPLVIEEDTSATLPDESEKNNDKDEDEDEKALKK